MKQVILLFSAVLVIFGCSSNNNGTVTVVPLAPTNLTGAVISTTQINLSWTDNATNEEGYKIERKTGAGNYAVVGSTSSNMTTYSDLGLTPSTSYTYRVYAYNSAGNSLQYSNEVTVTTSLIPSLITTPISDTTAISSTSGGNITSDAGSSVTARGICWSTSSLPTISLSTKTNDGTGTGIFISNLTGLIANTTYYVRAYATNANGTAYGNEVSFTTTNVDLVTGLVGYWPFNGNANDESGNGNNGTVNGATLTSDRFGISNKAYNFDGVSNYINVSDNQSIHLNNFSISAWVNGTDFNGFRQILTKNLSNSINESINLFINNLSIWNVSAQVGGPSYYGTLVTSPSIFNTTEWHHVLFTYNGINQTQYLSIDGIVVSSNTAQYEIQYDNSPLTIGAQFESSILSYFFSGKLDDIRIYNRALSASEVAYLAAH